MMYSSFSALQVENYFYYLTTDKTAKDVKSKEKTPITDKLLGSVKIDMFDADKLKEEY
ncbi:MAG: hypothetical protein PF693_04020 [Spirochaetia bacterium]|nr:hypothetical protein [Spirochaetia bacterium]